MEVKTILQNHIFPFVNMQDIAEIADLSPKGKYCKCPSCGQDRAYINTKGDTELIICNRRENCGYIGNPWTVLEQTTDYSKSEILKKLAELANFDLEQYSNQDKDQKLKNIYAQIDVTVAFKELEPVKQGNSFQCKCPSCKGKAFIPIKDGETVPKIYCSDNCGLKKSFYQYVKDRDALTPEATISLLESYSTYRPLIDPNIKIEKRVAQDEVIEYMEFDPNKKYKFVDIQKYLPQYNTLSKERRLKIVYTYLYNLAMQTPQKAKYGYYLKKRGIEPGHKALERIAYLSVKDFNSITMQMTSQFPMADLLEFGVFKYVERKDENMFSLYSIDKGGVMLVPSFDLYTNTVTAFQVRPTHPPKWMIDKKIKELRMSATDIIKPLPFGMGYKMLKDTEACIFTSEGHPDSLAIPDNPKGCSKSYFMAIPGVNGISSNQEVLGYLKGRVVYICFDQDGAGQEGAERFAKMLQAAGAIPIILLWNPKLGDDINQLRINGNIKKVF